MASEVLTLEDAAIFIASRRPTEIHGFKDEDKEFFEPIINKAVMGNPLLKQEYKRAYKKLDCDYYRDQLTEGQRDFSLIPPEPPQTSKGGRKPAIRQIDIEEDPAGAIGVDRNTWNVVKVIEVEGDDGPKRSLR